jgi:O-antigen/teichoic acid export membrane protein
VGLKERFPNLANTVYATATAGSAGLLLVLLLVAGRFLSVDDYGRFSYALAVATIIETVMDIGLAHVTVREVARDRERAPALLRHVLGLKLAWVAGGLLLVAIVPGLLRSDPVVVRLCYALGISAAIRSYSLTARGYLQGMNRFDLETLVVVSDRVLLLGFGIAALAVYSSVTALGLAFVLARVVMFAFMTMLLRGLTGAAGGSRPAYDRQVWRDLQAAALPLGFFMISLNLYSYVDTVILGAMRSNAEIGWYSAAYRIYEGLTYPPSIIASLVTPRLSYLFVHDRGRVSGVLSRALAGAALLGVVLGGAAVFAARPIIHLLFGEAFDAAVDPLRILAGGAVFVFCTWVLHAAAIATNLDRRLFLTTVVGLSSNIALNVLFIPRWGISGAAAATVVAEAITVTLLVAQLWRHLPRRA